MMDSEYNISDTFKKLTVKEDGISIKTLVFSLDETESKGTSLVGTWMVEVEYDPKEVEYYYTRPINQHQAFTRAIKSLLALAEKTCEQGSLMSIDPEWPEEQMPIHLLTWDILAYADVSPFKKWVTLYTETRVIWDDTQTPLDKHGQPIVREDGNDYARY